ncbi:ARM repeat-containing protein [Xylariaceae sp. FL1019]|nr:ARM repeat-containing protein [Xylariaceae sp. FL1019]
MAERLTDDQVAALLATLKKDVPIDAKVNAVANTKSAIKQHNVPDSCVAPLFDALRLASTNQHAALVNAGFTALNHLLTRLSRQEPKYLAKESKQTLALIVDKMGDQKDKFRALSIQAMATMYEHVPTDAERFVRNVAMVGKNPRAKESGLQWLLQMHKEHGLQFRTYVPALMELLEDADGMVRDAAKATVIDLFREAPNAAKSDLKRQLKNFKVRPAIEAAIVKELNPTSSKADPESRPASAMQTRPNLAASVSSHASERPTTPAPESKAEAVDPTYVNTHRELDEILKNMHVWFEGRESEQNWLKREESITKLRRLIAGNAPSDFPDLMVSGCRGLLDGILKGANSLRTSLSKESGALVQDLANTFGSSIDPMVELLMQTFIKLCAATKKIASQLANTTIETIIGRTTYTPRMMQHIWGACQDKNVQPRLYATGWLKILLKKEAHHKNHLEHGGGLDLVDKCIKKGLADPNPGVREKMRATYWCFAGIWSTKADAIMNGLDATAQKLLQKDPNNPNSPNKPETAAVRPGLGFSKSTMSSSKPSLRDTMMAQKKALSNTRNLPARPGSAMATISPVRTTSGTSNASVAPSATASATRPRPESAMKSHGGMSVAPMRPARRRPEMAARPATAGPYSVRSHDGPSLEQTSPPEKKTKTVNPKTISGSPRRTAPRPRPGHAAAASESSVNIPSPSKTPVSKPAGPPRTSPAKAKTTLGHFASSSPAKPDENLTFVVPSVESLKESLQPSSPSPTVPAVADSPEVVSPVVGSPPVVSPPVVSPTQPAAVGSSETQNDENAYHPTIPALTPSEPLQVYEDPFTVGQSTPRPVSKGSPERPVLEDIPVNEDAAKLPTSSSATHGDAIFSSPDKTRMNSRLLDSGVTRVKAQTLDVHGFRKLQSLIRENNLPFGANRFESLLVGLFEYIEAPLDNLSPQKVQDVKAQALATVKLLLKLDSDSFQPHVSRGLEALLRARSSYHARTHIVSGLELLADELVRIGDAAEITVTMTQALSRMDLDTAGYRSLSMGLHVLKELIEFKPSFVPNEGEVVRLTSLASRCLESKESGVRMDAVHLCVALHTRLGDTRFWECMKSVKEDPKSLITYYVVKRQRETAKTAAG